MHRYRKFAVHLDAPSLVEHEPLNPLPIRAPPRCAEETSLRRDLRHRERLAALPSQEQLVDARVRSIQETEAVLPSLDVQERLDRAVHDELVAKKPVVVE